MKNQNVWKKMAEFVLGKGFYIVLALCVVTIGVSGYYLIRGVMPAVGSETETPSWEVSGDSLVTLPDSQPTEAVVPELPDLSEVPVETVKPKEVESKPKSTEEPSAEEPKPETGVEATVYTWPVKGEVLRAFSIDTLSLDPTLGDWRTHAGLDIAAAVGTRVLCMTEGTVQAVFEDDRMGQCVSVEHRDGLVSTYCNLALEATVTPGTQVDTGDILGTVGESALVEQGMPSHLHLETCVNDKPVNPADYLPEH